MAKEHQLETTGRSLESLTFIMDIRDLLQGFTLNPLSPGVEANSLPPARHEYTGRSRPSVRLVRDKHHKLDGLTFCQRMANPASV